MPLDLLTLVSDELVPRVAPLGFRIVASEVADVFDNAFVVLEAPALRIRVLRERSIVVLDVGPVTEPGTWFDSAVVMDYLGLSSNAGFHDRNTGEVLRGASAFITSMWNDLTAMFGAEHLATTKNKLRALQDERATRLFGG